MPKCRTENIQVATDPQTSASTDIAKQSSGTAGHNKGAKLGAKTVKPTPRETAKYKIQHRYTHRVETAAEKRETAYPTCKNEHNDNTQRRTHAVTHPESVVAGLQEKADIQSQNHTTVIPPTKTHTRTTASTRGSYHGCTKEGDTFDDPIPLSLRRCHPTKAHCNAQGAPKANRTPYSAPQGNPELERYKIAPPHRRIIHID